MCAQKTALRWAKECVFLHLRCAEINVEKNVDFFWGITLWHQRARQAKVAGPAV